MRVHQLRTSLALLLATGVMVACGGGRGGGSSTFTGVAASGAAIADASVQVTCKSGAGSTTTNADGSYSVTLSSNSTSRFRSSSAQLPCLLQATNPVNGDTLHSMLAPGATTANITPLTDLVVANTLGQDPATAFREFAQSPALQAKVTQANIDASVLLVSQATEALRADTGTMQNPLTTTLIAATSANSGNALDKVLDAVMSALSAADEKFSALAALLKNTDTAETTRTRVNNLVNEAQYAMAGCPSARSGNIWMLELGQEARLFNVRYDRNQLRDINDANNPVDYAIIPSPVTPCAYTAVMNGIPREFRVSDSGLAAWQDTAGPNSAFGLTIPQQPSVSLTLDTLHGTYAGLVYVETPLIRFASPYQFQVTNGAQGQAFGATCDLNKPVPDCPGSATPIGIACEQMPGRPSGFLRCNNPNPDAELESTAVAFMSAGNVSIFVNVTRYKLPISAAMLNMGPDTTPLMGTGILALHKAGPITLPALGGVTTAGDYWTVGKNWHSAGFFPTSSVASTVTELDTTEKWYKKSTAPGVREYVNSPTNGLQLSKSDSPEDPRYSVRLQSPSGWALSFDAIAPYEIAGGLYAHVRIR